jgi:hypothetical protein
VSDRLFVSQSQLEAWMDDGTVTFVDDILTLTADNAAFRVEPAVQVKDLLDGDDSAGLLGATLTIKELVEKGAEHFQGSIILGDDAYECLEGYLGNPEGEAKPVEAAPQSPPAAAPVPVVPSPAPIPVPAAASPAPRAPAAAPPIPSPPVAVVPEAASQRENDENDAQLLTDFLLKNL